MYPQLLGSTSQSDPFSLPTLIRYHVALFTQRSEDHMAKAAAKKAPKKGFEETLWDTVNKLRGSVESSEYKHIVLSLIFLKFISNKFETQKARIESEYGANFVDMVDFYT